MYAVSPQLAQYIVKAASGGDKGLEDYLFELYPSFIPFSDSLSTSKAQFVLRLQMLLIEAALDKSVNLVDYYSTTRDMTSDFTNVSKTIGDGETDNYRNATSRMKDRENAWNRLEREGEEDTKNYHVSVSRSKGTEEGKSYDFSTVRNHSKGCSFDTAISKSEGKGNSKDFSHTVRSSSSLSRTQNLEPGGTAEFAGTTTLGDKAPTVVQPFTFNILGPIFVQVPNLSIEYTEPSEAGVTAPSCTAKVPSTTEEEEVTCENQAPSVGKSASYRLAWNWSASGHITTVSSSVSGGGEISESASYRTDQVCTSSSSSVNGFNYGFNNYSQTDSGYNEGRTKNWGVGNTIHQTGAMSKGERVNYGRSKGEVKGIIEFCSQTDSASRKRKVATGSVDAKATNWSRTITDSKGQSKKITNSKSSIVYWNQQVKNLKELHKLLQKRLDDHHRMEVKQGSSASEESLFRLCTLTAKADVAPCLSAVGGSKW